MAEKVLSLSGANTLYDDLRGRIDASSGKSRAFPQDWPVSSSTTTKAFCDAVNADSTAVQGVSYLGEVLWSDLPFNGNAEVGVEIMSGTGTSGKVIHLILTSGNVSPYRWEYTYWNDGSNVSGWIGFATEDMIPSIDALSVADVQTIYDGGYTITSTITNGSASGAAKILFTNVPITITPDSNYELPTTVTVTGADHTYDEHTGVVTLSNATGNVTITATCKAPTASVTGLGNQDPTSQVYTRDEDFPTSFEEVTFNGDVFIKIPTMYRKIDDVTNGQITAFTMATAQIDNTYEPYPCFVAPDSSILPYVLIGKYCYSSTSAAGSTRDDPATLAIGDARTLAQNRGTGYQQYDWQIQKLYVDLCLLISQSVNFNSGGVISNYLGVYDLDRFMWVDGWASTGSQWVIATNPANYINEPTSSSAGYTAVSYAQPTMTSREVMKLGYDSDNAFANFPSAVINDNLYTTYYCDGYYYSSGSHPVQISIGTQSRDRGLWFCAPVYNWTGNQCVRLCYRPISS